MLIGFLKDIELCMGFMGKGIFGSFVIVIDDDGKEVGLNVKGNIVVFLDLLVLFKGYFKDEVCIKVVLIGDYYVIGD